MDIGAYLEGFDRRDWPFDPDADPVRLAVVGVGGFARSHALPAIERSRLCETAALVDSEEERLAAVPSATGLRPEAFLSGDAADEYDAAYVAVPNADHLGYAEAAAGQGKAVLCEKPMEVSAERAARMVEACEGAGVALMVGYRMQLDPAIRRVRELIDAGAIGDPVHAYGAFSTPVLERAGGRGQWRLDPERSGGGALVSIGVYPINTIRFLLGAEPAAVRAETASTREPFADVDEHVSFGLSFPGGANAECAASFGAYRDGRLHVLGTEGRVGVERAFGPGEERRVVVERGDARAELGAGAADEVVEQFDYFAARVRDGGEIEPDGRDGLRDVEIMEAVYESAESGKRVAL